MTGRGGQFPGRETGFGLGLLTGRALLAAVVVALTVVMVPLAAAAAAVNPLLVGSTSSDPRLSGATSVAISGPYAYTTAYVAGELTAVDFSNPSRPVVASSSLPSSTLLNASTVNIAGGYAYVVSKNRNGPNGSGSNDDGSGNSLTILNISTNPAVPQIVGHVTDATKLFGAYGVAVSGNYAYVAAQGCAGGSPCPNPTAGNRFEVVDISDPTSPKIMASLANSALPAPFAGSNALNHACSVAISGTHAYVTAANSNRLTIIDISHPLSPVIDSSLQDNSRLTFPVDVAVQNSYAYVADQSSGLGRVAVVDVSDPMNPQVKTMVTDPATLNGAYRIRVRGNFAYVSGAYAATVTAIDISNPLNPVEAWHVTDAAHLNRTTGLDVDPSSNYVVAASPFLSTQSNPVYPPFSTAAATGAISVILVDPQAPVVTALPSISGTPMQGDLLTASNGAWLGVPPPAFAHQWFDCNSGGANCKAISGATSSTYRATANDVGARLEVTVRATNLIGSSQARSLPTSSVAPLPNAPPAITSLRQSVKNWRAGSKLAHITVATRKHSKKRPPVGTTFSFRLNKRARVTFTFTEHSTGRKVKGVCRRKTAKNRRRPHCQLSLGAGTLVLAAHQGADKVSFDGRLSHTRKLGPGRYTLALTAIVAGKRSKARTISFNIVS